MALGAGAGGFEGDTSRAQIALQARGQDITLRGQDMQRRMHGDDARRREVARRDEMAEQRRQFDTGVSERQRQFDAGMGQRNAERRAAEGRDARDFGESVRRFDLGLERQQREDAFSEMLKMQQLEDMRLKHQASQTQYDEMMAEVGKAREQRKGMEDLANSGIGMLLRAAYESDDGMAPAAAVGYVRKMLKDDNIIGMGYDRNGDGNFVLVMRQVDKDGNPVLDAGGNEAQEYKPFQADKARAILGQVYGDGVLKARDASFAQAQGTALTSAKVSEMGNRHRMLDYTEQRMLGEKRRMLDSRIKSLSDELQKMPGKYVLKGKNIAADKDGNIIPSEAYRKKTVELDGLKKMYDALISSVFDGGGADGVGGEDADYLEWARANPGDPYAKAILKNLGGGQ